MLLHFMDKETWVPERCRGLSRSPEVGEQDPHQEAGSRSEPVLSAQPPPYLARTPSTGTLQRLRWAPQAVALGPLEGSGVAGPVW